MKTKIISGIHIIILLLLLVGLSTVLEPCSGDKVMKCNYSVNAVKLLFVTGILVKGFEIFIKEQAGIYFELFSVFLLIDSILIPAWLIGGCKMADMQCLLVAFPSIYVASILLIVVNGISILFYLGKKRGNTTS